MNQIKVDFTNGDGKAVASYIIKRRSVALNCIRLSLQAEILKLKISDVIKSQMLSCAALASCTFKGKALAFPENEKEPLKPVYAIFNDLDIEVYDGLVAAHNEINPVEPTLTAKKKKS